MQAIKALNRVLNGRRPRDTEPGPRSPAWLARVERRLDEGDDLLPDDLARIREYLASLERSGPIPSG
jgi:hypothetical protein